ncbi:MAG TPA: LytTR family DNA-binding domain-containing protein, partial [Negativicutes bacterium]|nr:LytTR family DNA-binding domain-containing protein [Negativicutes bacterium]
MIKIVIADDEPHVCKELEYIIGRESELKIVKVCHNGTEALEQISKLQPEIVFLDIEMPGLNGIQLGYYLKNMKRQPYLIFVTAYGDFALDAFKVGAKGYILKPFSEEDVQEQIRQAREYIERQTPTPDKGREIPKTKIPVQDNGKFKLLDQQTIVLAYANDRAVYVRSDGTDYMVDFSLAELEGHLQKNIFIRCHRNHIVNISKVKEVVPWFNSTYMLVMEGETNVPVSRA